MHTLRARIGGDIISEFLPPSNYHSRKKNKAYKDKAIIICDGMPTVPSKKNIMLFLSRKGYWVFHIRYRGSWESSGLFLQFSPEKDVLDTVDAIYKKIKSIYDGKIYKLNSPVIFIIASSFGGPAGILASRDRRVNKVVAFSPVVDWTVKSKKEPLTLLYKFVVEAFGEAYRCPKNNWKKLIKGNFYNPAKEIDKIVGDKILIVHAIDDDVVSYSSVKKFSNKTNSDLITVKKGGHLSMRILTKKRFYKRLKKHFSK